MRENNLIIEKEIVEMLDLTVRTITRIASKLREQGFISRPGGNKYGRWVILK